MEKQKRGFVVPDTSKRFGLSQKGSPSFNSTPEKPGEFSIGPRHRRKK